MSTSTSPLVLTIDDERNIRESFCGYLEDFDYQVIQAENGRVGLETFDREKPDLVLVDLRMPEVDGLDVLGNVKKRSPETPIIVVSGTGVIGDVVEALRLGAWDYLVKPIEDLSVLLHAVQKALERARLIQENRAYQEHLENEVKVRTAELIGANRALRESEEKFRNIVESAPMGMHMYQVRKSDAKLVLHGANPSADWILGLDNSNNVGKTMDKALSPYCDSEMLDKCWRVAEMGEPWHKEQVVSQEGRVSKALELNAFQTAPGKMVVAILDTTHRRRAAEERERLIADLEGKNAELERFSYTVSHDLKTPLITIRGFLDMLDQDLVDGNIEPARKHMVRIAGAADKLHRLLGELLDLSRVGHVIGKWTDIPLNDLIREAAEQNYELSQSKRITLDVAPDLPQVQGDRLRLLEVLQNLLDNAVRYMADQPAPKIEIGAKPDNERVLLYVKDNGIGIEKRYHQKVFGLFDKLDAEGEGTGVGLALVKRVVELHGGKVWIESEGSGCGATFLVTLPSGRKNPNG